MLKKEVPPPVLLIQYVHHQVGDWTAIILYNMENRWFNQYNNTWIKTEECIWALTFLSYSPFYLLTITGSLLVTCEYFEVPPESFIKELMNNQWLIISTQWGLGWWERFRLRLGWSGSSSFCDLMVWCRYSLLSGVHSQSIHLLRSASFQLLQTETWSKGDWY